jgi:hypothetical protein
MDTDLRSSIADRWHPDVVILTAMGEEAAVEAKEAPKQG